jgi:predicted HAD superfamily phosphohydrolase YqeG
MKPLPFAFFKARHLLGAPRAHCLVIGDQLITDVLGARLSGLDAVWVDPLSTTDLWYTRIFRRFEAFYLRHHSF